MVHPINVSFAAWLVLEHLPPTPNLCNTNLMDSFLVCFSSLVLSSLSIGAHPPSCLRPYVFKSQLGEDLKMKTRLSSSLGFIFTSEIKTLVQMGETSLEKFLDPISVVHSCSSSFFSNYFLQLHLLWQLLPLSCQF